MSVTSRNVVVAAGAIVSLLLQALVAPYISIGYAHVDFPLAYVVAMAIIKARTPGYLMPFLVGLAYDLMSSCPVGAMALLFTLVTFAASQLFVRFDNETLFIPIVLIIFGVLAVNVLYAVVMCAFGVDVGFAQALLYRGLPCSLYDTVVSLVIFPIMSWLFARLDAGSGLKDVGSLR